MNEEVKQYPPLVIRLVTMSETNWVMEGTEKDPAPIRMSWPSLHRIIPTSKVRVDIPKEEGGGYKYVAIRHIAGCDFIDPVRQDKEGFKPNPEQDNIWISQGTATFLHEGSTIGTYLYMKAYQGNISNLQRPPDAESEFEELIAVEIARETNSKYDRKADAYAILREIRQPAGEDTFQYDEEKLGLLSTLFDLNHLGSEDEKFTELYRIADTRPELIVNSIANGKKKLFALIKKAEDLSVISFTDEKVVLTETKTAILVFKGRHAKNTQVNKLSDYLLTEDGKIFMQQLTKSVETASARTLERVGN